MNDPIPTPQTKRATLTPDYQRDWPMYFDAVADKPPRDTLVRALALFAAAPGSEGPHPVALDIACGEGRDTRAILRSPSGASWKVIASDSSDDGLARLRASLSEQEASRTTLNSGPMESLPTDLAAVSPGSLAIVNASFALPFCSPDAFPTLWRWIVASLKPGGRFAGQFFGDRDEWKCVRPKSHFNRSEVAALLAGFDVEHLDEVEKEGDDAMGGIKHHHVFHVVARKR